VIGAGRGDGASWGKADCRSNMGDGSGVCWTDDGALRRSIMVFARLIMTSSVARGVSGERVALRFFKSAARKVPRCRRMFRREAETEEIGEKASHTRSS